jgi:hypothetical protein
MTHSPDSNKICCPLLATGNLHKSKISDLIFSLCPSLCKSACCYCYYLTVLLPFPNTPCTSQLQDLQINSLIREYFHKGVLVTQNGIKAFHKFIHICSLIHVHSPKRSNTQMGKFSFLFICDTGVWIQDPHLSQWTSPIFVGYFEAESQEVFAQADIEPWSSWSLLAGWQGLQPWDTSTQQKYHVL